MMKTYPQIQAIPHTDSFVNLEQQTKEAFIEVIKGAGFAALVSIISENELIGFSFFKVNVILAIAGGIYAFRSLRKVYKLQSVENTKSVVNPHLQSEYKHFNNKSYHTDWVHYTLYGYIKH